MFAGWPGCRSAWEAAVAGNISWATSPAAIGARLTQMRSPFAHAIDSAAKAFVLCVPSMCLPAESACIIALAIPWYHPTFSGLELQGKCLQRKDFSLSPCWSLNHEECNMTALLSRRMLFPLLGVAILVLVAFLLACGGDTATDEPEPTSTEQQSATTEADPRPSRPPRRRQVRHRSPPPQLSQRFLRVPPPQQSQRLLLPLNQLPNPPLR